MGRFLTYSDILSNKVGDDFGVSQPGGTSLTIPGQGSDLSQIIASIVKLPPLDERTFDCPAGTQPDERALQVGLDLEGMYKPEAVNLASDAAERKKARKLAEEASNEADKSEGTEDAKAE